MNLENKVLYFFQLDYYHEIHLDTIYVHSTFGVVVDEELFHDITVSTIYIIKFDIQNQINFNIEVF